MSQRLPKVGDRVFYKTFGWNGTIKFISSTYHYGKTIAVEWDGGGHTAFNFDEKLPAGVTYIYEVEGFEV